MNYDRKQLPSMTPSLAERGLWCDWNATAEKNGTCKVKSLMESMQVYTTIQTFSRMLRWVTVSLYYLCTYNFKSTFMHLVLLILDPDWCTSISHSTICGATGACRDWLKKSVAAKDCEARSGSRLLNHVYKSARCFGQTLQDLFIRTFI